MLKSKIFQLPVSRQKRNETICVISAALHSKLYEGSILNCTGNRHFHKYIYYCPSKQQHHGRPSKLCAFSLHDPSTKREQSTMTETRPLGSSFPIIGEEHPVDRTSEIYNRNKKSFQKFVDKYNQAKEISLAGGGEKSMERHVKRHKKMLITDRVKALVDNIDDFLELSLIGGIGMEYGHVPRASILTGIGKIQGRYCLIVANDGAFKGGAVYPITLKKQLRAQEIAAQNYLPCVYLVDSAGAFLPLQADIFNTGGQTFYNQAVLSSRKIPQIAIVCGSCTAGGAYVPTMADEAVIVHKTGTIFLGGPPLVQAALGEIVTAEELGGATVHCGTSGCTDYFAVSEPEAFETGRRIVSALNLPMKDGVDMPAFDEPLRSVDEIPGLIPPPHRHQDMNMYQVISRLVDGSRFHEFKVMFGKTLLTGFAHIKGHLVGIVSNHGEINEDAAAKGAHFVQLCCERDVPIVFLQNTAVSGEQADENVSKQHMVQSSNSLKSQARMLAAVSCATVPKLTVIVGDGFGPTHYLMGGRAVSPDFLFAWPNARVGVMDPKERLESVIQTNPSDQSQETSNEEKEKLLGQLTQQSSSLFGATRISNDGIIMPSETRKVLSQCLSICKAYRRPQDQDYPVLRM